MSNRRLLLADDSLTIQKVVNLTFSDEGFDVQTVGDGDSALAAIHESRPDIVLADVNMPGADGYSICEKLRSNDATNKIPVILLVGSFEPFDEEKAGFVGADAFLTKPFQSIRQLISQVNELLDAAPSTNGHGETEQPSPTPLSSASPPDDIASLYSQSFAEDGSKDIEEDLEQSMSGFDDSGLDDEMIETSYLADKSNYTLDFEIAGNNDAAESIREEDAGLAPGIDQYFNEPVPVTTGYETSPLDDPFLTPVEQTNYSEPVVDEPSEAKESFDETIPNADPGLSDPLAQVSEPISDYFAEPEPRPFVSNESSEEPLSQMGIETVSFDEPAPSRSFDEIDLLDIPPIGSSDTVELTTAERAEIMGSDKQAVSISPELMELIVQKVVEKMSQKY